MKNRLLVAILSIAHLAIGAKTSDVITTRDLVLEKRVEARVVQQLVQDIDKIKSGMNTLQGQLKGICENHQSTLTQNMDKIKFDIEKNRDTIQDQFLTLKSDFKNHQSTVNDSFNGIVDILESVNKSKPSSFSSREIPINPSTIKETLDSIIVSQATKDQLNFAITALNNPKEVPI